MKRLVTTVAVCLAAVSTLAARPCTVCSPDGTLRVTVTAGNTLTWSLDIDGRTVIEPTPVGITLGNGTEWGRSSTLKRLRTGSVDDSFGMPFYTKSTVDDRYNWLRAEYREGFAFEVRVYDDGAAYRFVPLGDKPLTVIAETAGARFAGDWLCRIPYVRYGEGKTFDEQFFNSFENVYTVCRLSEMDAARLAFLPLAVETDSGIQLCFTESDLQDYPAMYLNNPDGGRSLRGIFTPRAAGSEPGGYIGLQNVITRYDDCIARFEGRARMPWRTVLVARSDRDLLANDMVVRLAEPSRIGDVSWIRPGKAAWEWWNAWGLFGVDFEAGINTPTYKYYVDFAADCGLQYLVVDDGWARDQKHLLEGSIDDLDLQYIVDYAARRGVGIILWAGFMPFERDMEEVCRHYAGMGVKGFKVDFMDRGDQDIARFLYRGAEVAARYGLVLDYHGIYKPAGLTRTWPNVLNFEGVHGLEQMKWSPESLDQATYDVTMPYIRMAAGPVDYTQGAMLNDAPGMFVPRNGEPSSQGTRCRQIAQYVVFHSPLAMLCDSPSRYLREQECTRFISAVPTVWDDTKPVAGRMGEYLLLARRKGDVWYVAGMTDREARTVEVDLSFLGEGEFAVELFCDGPNASRHGVDYRRTTHTLDGSRRTITIEMAPSGGFAARIAPKNQN